MAKVGKAQIFNDVIEDLFVKAQNPQKETSPSEFKI
jgi:hypothetical protein